MGVGGFRLGDFGGGNGEHLKAFFFGQVEKGWTWDVSSEVGFLYLLFHGVSASVAPCCFRWGISVSGGGGVRFGGGNGGGNGDED